MASYLEWNDSIIDFFTSGVRGGAPVYLTVDDSSLAYIGHHYLELPAEAARNDFISAVKERCTERVGSARRVKLDGAKGIARNGRPNSVSFLAVMVLAAHEMQADEKQHIDGTNYFRRFTELLDLSQGQQSRPQGFISGEEEELWRTWNSWVALNGFKPTARGGEGSHVYIDYPIEQALLRKGDRAFIESRMRYAFISPQDRMLDEAQLASWLMRQAFSRRHLQAGFRNPDPDRVGAFIDAAFRIYQAIDWVAGSGSRTVQGSDRIKLSGGIIRKVSIRGPVQYQLLVRRPSHWKSAELKVLGNRGEYHSLVPFKSDLFVPLWAVSPFPNDPLKFEVGGDPLVESLIFPMRNFWILTTDPDDPTGQIGTWERYPNLLGQKFWILLRGAEDGLLAAELRKYKNEKLIDWEQTELKHDGWTEYRGCMILSRAWDCIVPSAGTESLYDALTPTMFANIGLSRGIKAPDGQGWLEGFPPSITIYGFERDFKVEIRSEIGPSVSFEVQQQVPRLLPESLAPGGYQLMASWHGRLVASRSLRIIAWDDLDISKNVSTIDRKIGGLSLHGASIELLGSSDRTE
ncbi:hypothetical protein [Nitrosovibrio sp. Nv6]|uniref:hypothetical protein n=1 Tax=Nitrosovibrio sp. Nv6 TaxID=1855340 RepID=UPI0008B0F41F|nr:hypothetical protein [Nitrosovibrio sp. Nv6]SEO88520.1 hypothetical protein SAMN05216316_1363 [Nitrosovibrio sp. Nv6]